MKSAVIYIQGKGGNETESKHWFHTKKQMCFPDEWILSYCKYEFLCHKIQNLQHQSKKTSSKLQLIKRHRA